MKKENRFDYKAAELDERVIDEIFSRRRCNALFVRVPTATLKLTPKERKKLLELYPPKKKPRLVDPFKYILTHLTALIGNKNLLEKDRRKYMEDKERYKKMQSEYREQHAPPRGRKMYPQYITRDQLYDLVFYIATARKRANVNNRDYTLKEAFALAAKIYNKKKNGIITAKQARDSYYRA